MNFLKVARSILSSDLPSEVTVNATMGDGAGEEVEYAVECSVGDGDFDVRSVTRVDTSQDVDPEAFKTMFGKAALLKLMDTAAERAAEIGDARAEEELGSESSAPVEEPAPVPSDPGPGPQAQQAARARARRRG